MILQIPSELHTTILTYLRATDLSSLQQTCRTFSHRPLIQDVITTFATEIYPPELTKGYDTPTISGEPPSALENNPSFEILRNMEMLIVARVLSRPEPPLSERDKGCFYVSKAWCKSALKWLDVVEEQRKERLKLKIEAAERDSSEQSGKKKQFMKSHKKQTKKMKKQERKKRNTKYSDTAPPNPTVNDDLVCEHGFLKQTCSIIGRSGNEGGNQLSSPNNNIGLVSPSTASRSSRAKRRLMDKQAWKVLKKLYPEGIQLSSLEGECIQCKMEIEAKKKNIEMKKQKETELRRKPLQNAHVRKFYTRTRGVPKDCLKYLEGEYENKFALNVNPMKKFESIGNKACPLSPGIYYIIPRAWCHKWRKYIKTGEGSRPCAPDSSSCLCDAHRLPLIPPHLESFLYGETSSLLGTAIDLAAAMTSDCDLMDIISNGSAGENIHCPLAASSNNGPSSNIMTIHDLHNSNLRNTSAVAATSTSSASSIVSSPRPLPVGLTPIDQRLGGWSRSRSNSHSSFSSPIPADRRRSRSNSFVNENMRSPSSSDQSLPYRPRSRSNSQSNVHTAASASVATAQQRPQSQEFDAQIISTLRMSGLSESEIRLQRYAMMQIEEERQRAQLLQQQQHRLQMARLPSLGQSDFDSSITSPNAMSPEEIRVNLNAKLDYENRVVVEILTEEEYSGLEEWWPEIHSSYALKFAVLGEDESSSSSSSEYSEIVFGTSPCRSCDATGHHSNQGCVIRNRSRNWVNNIQKKKRY